MNKLVSPYKGVGHANVIRIQDKNINFLNNIQRDKHKHHVPTVDNLKIQDIYGIINTLRKRIFFVPMHRNKIFLVKIKLII